MLRLILAVAVAVLLGGCSVFNCGGAAVPGAAAADCGVHTTFLASAAQSHHPRALAKS